ncbi:sugar ABC transporter permease [Paenibacillus sp. TRM 82003]|nr:sugar ABC transporter permease [Paenibacillus sp. TRM 82003]
MFLCLFTFYPMLQTMYNSLFHIKLGIPAPVFAGLEHYLALPDNDVFVKVMRNTFWFVVATVPSSMLLALAFALFVNRKLAKSNGLLRAIFFYPTVIPAIAIANIWLFIYTPEYGILARFLGVFGIPSANLLGQVDTALGATIVMSIWKEASFLLVFYLAGLQGISKDLYEAAEIDGAKPWLVFRKITFPLLMPTTLFVFIIATTGAFRLVDHLLVMTKGGPDNATNLLLYYIYETAFTFWDQGVASTLTVVLVLLLLIVSSVQFFGMDRKIHYD